MGILQLKNTYGGAYMYLTIAFRVRFKKNPRAGEFIIQKLRG